MDEDEKVSIQPITDSIVRLDSTLQSLARSFSDHPGFMWTNSGFEVLHADWPAYPRGHGTRQLLSALADFPRNTLFYPIDNIDQCTLFIVGRQDPSPFNRSHYHVAIWDEDLREAKELGFIQWPSQEESVACGERGMVLTTEGHHAILVNELTHDLDPQLFDRVEELLYIHRYDAAVREATILLETELRDYAGVDLEYYGQKLLDLCFADNSLLFAPQLGNAYRIEIRSQFRRFFKYVRNDFAHNLSEIDVVTCIRLLRRSSVLFQLARDLRSMSRA